MAGAPDDRHRAHFLVGIPLVTVLVLAMRMGWPGANWLQNPLPAAAATLGGVRIEGAISEVQGFAGAVFIALTAASPCTSSAACSPT